jgi:uncharacterized membrane protein YhdT
MTDQKIEIEYREQTPVQAHLYIIECQSLGGFSGSPVFFELNRLLRDRYFVTPCYLLNELLYTDAAIKDRNYRSSQLKSIK